MILRQLYPVIMYTIYFRKENSDIIVPLLFQVATSLSLTNILYLFPLFEIHT
jgi:hypothetical protein